jgi:DNA-binding NarL/FixJ family response regulator
MIRVLLADDHPLVRQGLRLLIEQDPKLTVVAEAADGVQALALIQETRPDVVLLDIEMPCLSGVEVMRQLCACSFPGQVLILSAYADEWYVRRLVKYGVAGYLTKSEAPEYIIQAIHDIAKGGKDWFSQQVIIQMQQWMRQQEEHRAVSEQEQEVLHLIVQGMTNEAIGHSLHISPKAVEKRIRVLLQKAGVASRIELAVWAIQQGQRAMAAAGRFPAPP